MNGVLANSNTCAVSYSPTVESEEAFVDANLRIIAQKDGALTIRVDAIPAQAIPFNVMVTLLKSREGS